MSLRNVLSSSKWDALAPFIPQDMPASQFAAVMDLEDFRDAFPPEMRLAATVVWNTIVVPSARDQVEEKKDQEPNRTCLNLSKKLRSFAFSSLPSYRKGIEEVVRDSAIPFDRITRIDLSSNDLMDTDMKHVLEIANKCPQCQMLDLSANRFYGANQDDDMDKHFLELFTHPSLLFVVITQNPMASIDRTSLFNIMDTAIYERLVFLPPSWLRGTVWHRIVPPDRRETVLQTHLRFFREYLPKLHPSTDDSEAQLPFKAYSYPAIPPALIDLGSTKPADVNDIAHSPSVDFYVVPTAASQPRTIIRVLSSPCLIPLHYLNHRFDAMLYKYQGHYLRVADSATLRT